jgi:tyrosinase
MVVHMGPGLNTSYAPQCLTRDLSPWLATQKLQKAGVIKTLAGTNFWDFDIKVQGDVTVEGLTYHGGGHLSVGGDLGVLGNVYSSPGDPLFYLHHSNMDRLWWKWQQAGKPADYLCLIFLLIWYAT